MASPEHESKPDPDDYQGFTRWVLKHAQSGRAAPALFVAGVLDSSVVPMPLEIPLAGLMIGARWKIPLFLAAVVAGAVAGAGAMYAAGAVAMEAIASMFGGGLQDQVQQAADRVRDNSFAVIALGGLTPFPWPMVALGAGAAKINPLIFLAGAVAGRGGRFALIAIGVALFGDHALSWWTKAPDWVRIGFWVAIFALGAVWLYFAVFTGGGGGGSSSGGGSGGG